jgi:hypothetical protein
MLAWGGEFSRVYLREIICRGYFQLSRISEIGKIIVNLGGPRCSLVVKAKKKRSGRMLNEPL